MKRRKIYIIAAIAAVIAIGCGVYIFLSSSASNPITVETVLAKKGTITKMVTATGTVQPITKIAVGTQVSGVVEKIYVDFNSVVKKGQLIAELDKANLKAALLQAQAQYDNALNEQRYLQTIFDRQKGLYDNNFLSQADYDLALYNLNNAKSTVTQRLSDLQRAQSNLSYANIYSPIDGVVLSRDVDKGQTVAASYSTPTLFTIAQDLKQMQVEADVDEADIGQVKEDLRVSFTVDAFPEVEFAGTVMQVRLNPTTSSNVVTYTVVIKADNPDLKLKPGMTATISIYTLELHDVLTVPSKVINFSPDMQLLAQYETEHNLAGQLPPNPTDLEPPSTKSTDMGTTVWLLDSSSHIQPLQITIGASDGINVEVKSGINENDKLVYSLKNSGNTPNGPPSSGSPFMPKPPGGKK